MPETKLHNVLPALARWALAAGIAFSVPAHAQSGIPGSQPEYARDARMPFSQRVDFPALEGAVDPDHYTLGPGDELELALVGRATARVPLVVDAEGSVYVPNVGHVRVAGLTLTAARELLSRKFAQTYRGVRPDLGLVRPRRVRVQVAGEVRRPGLVELQAPGRVSEAVIAAGDTTSLASYRNIEVRHVGAPARMADLARFTLLGATDANPWIQEGDVIFVPARQQTCEIEGEVVRPGVREYRAGDRLADVLALCGGLRAWADSDTVELWRFDSPTRAVRSELPIRAALTSPGGPGDWALRPGDRVYVKNVADWHRRAAVYVRGEVMHPGIYAIPPDGVPASELPARFGGFTSYADIAGSMIIRPSARPLRDSLYVSLLQGVSRDLTHEELEYLKLHTLAQGDLSERLRDAFAGRTTEGSFRLMDGDVIIVPTRTHSVAVYGAVRKPGVVPYAPGKGVTGYVELAGGFGDRADRGEIRVTHLSNAQPVPEKDLREIAEGDIIWVPERQPGNFIKSLTSVATVLAQLATIYLVIHQSTQ